MKKINTLFLTVLFALSMQASFAANQSSEPQNIMDNSSSNFENYSYNVSDEQLKPASNVDDTLQQDKKASFWSKIVNSSHFSSNTATRTWIPLNKAK